MEWFGYFYTKSCETELVTDSELIVFIYVHMNIIMEVRAPPLTLVCTLTSQCCSNTVIIEGVCVLFVYLTCLLGIEGVA